MKLDIQRRFPRLVIPVVIAAFLMALVIGPGNACGVPMISITSVVTDTSVTIYGYNFPADQTFTVRMGPYGTYALGGTVVGTKDPSSGTTFTATYNIPSSLVGSNRVAIRMDSPQGYYSFNWFYNNTTTPVTTSTAVPSTIPGYFGYPTFNISSVVKNVSVTVITGNLPPNQTITVRMGDYGTYALGGSVVDTFDSGTGGTLTKTFTIPAALADYSRIAIRMDCPAGYYAYNWFWNNASSPIVPGYVGIPTFTIQAVVKDSSVTIYTNNFPADQSFTVSMGAYGTQALGGIVVDTIDSGSGGSFSETFTIPAALAGSSRIAIRFDSEGGYFYAYNWFWNNTTN